MSNSFALETVMNSTKNAAILSKVAGNADDIYQAVGDVINGKPSAKILADLKAGKRGWRHPDFERITLVVKERDDFIVTPFEVEEGVLTCKCGSKRTYSYQRQIRSLDEPTSTFAQCVVCKRTWIYSG